MQNNKGAEYWTNHISEQEMPALCSTVRELEKLAKDDVSSLTRLGRSVMHDNALTSRILRVANSATYNKGISQVTTVSRAAVVLGFDTIRNICITAKLLSNLLENKNLSQSVYERLLKLMAQSFHGAMIARMILSDRDESLREEVFIATLLYHIGESAFWSMGGAKTDELDSKLAKEQDTVAQLNLVRQELGASFNQITQGIARSWGLGELLQKSLVNPDDRMPEIRAVFIADKIAQLLTATSLDSEQLNKRLQQCAEIMGISTDALNDKLHHCNQVTHKLAHEYGARVLLEFIPNTQKVFETLASPSQLVREPDLKIQMQKLRELTPFAIEKTDFNTIIQTTLEGILNGVGVDRCGMFLLSPNRQQLHGRIMLGDDAEKIKNILSIDISQEKSAFKTCIESSQSQWIDSLEQSNNADKVSHSDPFISLLSASGYIIAPIKVDKKVLGLFYADRHSSLRRFEQADVDSFLHFSQLANVCLTLSMSS